MKRPRTSRMRKVNELMREVIAEEVTRLKDPRLGFVTITEVRTSPDLRRATVFFSVLDPADTVGSTEALQSSHHRIQQKIAREGHLKYTPVLDFKVDEALERGLRISKLLRNIDGDSSE